MSSGGETSLTQPPHAHLYASVLILTACWVVFGQTLGFDFVDYDDPVYVTENPNIAGGLTPANIAWAFTGHHGANWFPLTWLSHMLDLEIFGLKAWGHHFTNVLLHSANALLLYWVLVAYTSRALPSALVALLFAIHPLHVESVAWVTGRKDLLSTFFGLWTLLGYKRDVQKPSRLRYAAVFVAMAASLMAKSMLVTLPFLLLLLDFWPLGRIASFRFSALWPLIREKLPLFGLSIASAVITVLVQRAGGAVRGFDTYPFAVRIENALAAYVEYIKKCFWPDDLIVLYVHPGDDLPRGLAIGCAVLLIGASGLALALYRRAPWLAVGWFWFLGTLVPVIGLVQVGGQAMADRYTYVPLIGLFIIIAWSLYTFASSRNRRAIAYALSAAAIVALTVAAHHQTRYWRDSFSLYTHALDVNQFNKVIQNNLGHVLLKRGDTQTALSHFWYALYIDPGYVRARINAANTLVTLGEYESAIEHYRGAIDTDPSSIEARTNLGNTLLGLGRFEEAVQEFTTALSIDPIAAESHNNLGAALYQLGDYERAAAEFSAALWLRPGYAKAANNLAAARAKLGLRP